jgi:hypothetical protein
MNEPAFPDIFYTGDLGGRTDGELCADALCAWAITYMGRKYAKEIPEMFGEVLVAIGAKIGCRDMTADGLLKFSAKFIK